MLLCIFVKATSSLVEASVQSNVTPLTFEISELTPFPSPAFSFCASGSVIFGLKAASSCLAPSSSVALLLYSVASVLMLSLCCESFLGYVSREDVERFLYVYGVRLRGWNFGNALAAEADVCGVMDCLRAMALQRWRDLGRVVMVT